MSAETEPHAEEHDVLGEPQPATQEPVEALHPTGPVREATPDLVAAPAGVLLRAATIGAVSGARTFTGLGVMALTTPQHADRQPERAYASWPGRAVLLALASGELTMDKFPKTPSRLQPPPLIGRLAAAAACGVLVARRSPTGTLSRSRTFELALAAGTACAGAGLEALVGVRWRAWAEKAFGSDLPGALIEDALAVGAAWATTRRAGLT